MMSKTRRSPKAGPDGGAYELVDKYLDQLTQQKLKDQETFLCVLRENHESFRVPSFKASGPTKQYPLLVKIIEYHLDTAGWEVVTSQVHSLGDLSSKLAQPLQPCVRAQLLCFSLNEDLPSRHFGKVAIRRERQVLKSLNTTWLCVVGAHWGLSASQIWQLVGNRTRVGQEGSASIRLPSWPKDRFFGLDAESIHTMAATATPLPFESDLAQYINQKHCDAPRRESVAFYYDGQDEACWRAVVACSTAGVMDELSKRFGVNDAHDKIEGFALDPRLVTMTISTYVIEMMIDNLAKISDYLENMTYEARRGPSYGKLNYVLHLQDHLEALLPLVAPLQETTAEWPTLVNKPSDQQRLTTTRSDCEYLMTVAKELHTKSEKLQAMIKQQVEGKSNSRTTLFAIIAAVYLPLTLATGIFGMNIKQITAPKSSPTWQDVIYLGLPLVAVSVAVPLTADRVYRQIQTYAGSRPRIFRWWLYWGPILLVGAVIVVVVVVEVTKK